MTDVDQPRPGSPAALRQLNRSRVIFTLQTVGETTQAELARQTELAPATISNIITSLRHAGLVIIHRQGGRRVVRLAPRSGFVVGVDYGHRHVTVAIAAGTDEVLVERRTDFAAELSAEKGLALAAELTRNALKKAGVEPEEVISAAMGLPAPIERATSRVGSPTILPGWVGIDVGAMAAEVFGLPVRFAVDNDANLGALAEHRWGAGVGVTDLAYLKLSEGVGAGLILGGRAYSGPSGTAGEIGHTTVDEFGTLCRCGNRGCLETLVSARHVISLLEPTHGAGLTITEVVQQADEGDRGCARVLGDVGLQVGIAVADLCSLLNPELVVVGGELAQAGEHILAGIRQVVARRGVPIAAQRLTVTTSKLGARAHVLGAVALALDSLFA